MKRSLDGSSSDTADNHKSFEPGDEVRLVNLPAYPGLEGLPGVVKAVDESKGFVDVELRKTGAVKRLKTEKLRHVFSQCIVELHGLVAAYKLNGQLGEVLGFDWDMQRYDILLQSGASKKVKPENVRYVASYSLSPVSSNDVRTLRVDHEHSSLSGRCNLFSKWQRPLPQVVSSRVLCDWAKLDDSVLRRRLIETKRVDLGGFIAQHDDVSGPPMKLLFLSWSRSELVSDEIVDHSELFARFCRSICTPQLEIHWGGQVYFILPMAISGYLGLPLMKQAIEASLPLLPWLADGLVMADEREPTDDGILGISNRFQIFDVLYASRTAKPMFYWNGGRNVSWTKTRGIYAKMALSKSITKLLEGPFADNDEYMASLTAISR